MLFLIKNALDFSDLPLNGHNNEPIEYCKITGIVKPDNTDLVSHYNINYRGVVRIIDIREHGTTWRNNISSDTSRIISRVVTDVPFSLINYSERDSRSVRILVNQPLNANYLLDNLDLTHKSFEPSQQSLVSKLFTSVLTNEVVRGVETSEYMLRNNAELTCFGRVEKLSDLTQPAKSIWSTFQLQPQYRLVEPTKKGYTYIITTLSQPALIERLKRTTKWLKVSLILFGTIGLAVGAYSAYKYGKEYFDKRRRTREIARAKEQHSKNRRLRFGNSRSTISAANNENSNEQSSPMCVICLLNPRELVLLNCGHVCLCMDCFERMPNRNCPICRQQYVSFAPCYIP
jgi:E3 ubiquitin-protein ligase MUL1